MPSLPTQVELDEAFETRVPDNNALQLTADSHAPLRLSAAAEGWRSGFRLDRRTRRYLWNEHYLISVMGTDKSFM